MTKSEENEKEHPIRFFGAVDRQPNGRIRSQYPAWYFENAIEDLKETISFKERQLEQGLVEQPRMGEFKASLKQDRDRLSEVEESRPRLSGKHKDDLAKLREQFGGELKDLFPSYTDSIRGTCNAQLEADKMITPCVKVDNDLMPIVRSMGITPVNGMISRNQACKAWQVAGKALGETTDTGTLQNDHVDHAFKLKRTLFELMEDMRKD